MLVLLYGYQNTSKYRGDGAPRRAGTLERVVKYDAFSKAWDYLAAPTSDGEDD